MDPRCKCCAGACLGCVTTCPAGASCDDPGFGGGNCWCTAPSGHTCVRSYSLSATISNTAKKCITDPDFYESGEFFGCVCGTYDDSSPRTWTKDTGSGLEPCPTDLVTGVDAARTWTISATIPADTTANAFGRYGICVTFDSGIVGSGFVTHRVLLDECGTIVVEVWDGGSFFHGGSCLGPTLHCRAEYYKRAGSGSCVTDGTYDLNEDSVTFTRCHAYVVSTPAGNFFCELPGAAYSCVGYHMSEEVTGTVEEAEEFGWTIPRTISVT